MDEPTVAFTKVSDAPRIRIKSVHIKFLGEYDDSEDATEAEE